MSQITENRLSRRSMLKLMGGVLGTAVLSGCGVQSQESNAVAETQQSAPSAANTIGYYTVSVGDIQLTAISDSMLELEATIFGVNAPASDIETFLTGYNMPTDFAKAGVNCLLAKTGDELVLMDTGMGDTNPEAPGQLINTLNVLGVQAEDITAVLVSHFHFDHIAGVSFGDKAAFPNAKYFFPETEWDFLKNAPSGTPVDDLIEVAKQKMAPMVKNDQVSFYKGGSEIVSGIQAVDAFGHTPGHSIFEISSNGQTLMNMVDVANHSLMALENPQWHFGYDFVPDEAVETRLAMYGRAADEKIQILGYHFPFPGIGYVVRNGEGFRYLPTG